MTMPLVALCADSTCLQHPETMGLAGENLASQAWLRLFCSAEEARRFLRTDQAVDEVWVVSSEDVAPINLAATLKRDRSDRAVCMLAFQNTGSLKSRVSATGIDAFLTQQAFLERYAQRKRRAADQRAVQQYPCGPVPAAAGGMAGCAMPATAPAAYSSAGSVTAPATHPSAVPVTAPAPAMASATSAYLSATASPATAPAPAAAAYSSTAPAAASAPATYSSAAPATRSYAMPGALAAEAPVTHNNAAFLMPVVSGSGGAGKSTVAVLAALLSQGLGFDTLLLDFDLQFGDVPDLLGAQNALGIEDVLAAPARLVQLRPEGRFPALLTAPKRLEDAEAVVQNASALLDQLMARFDVIICNTGASWAEQHAVLLERSSKALFLIDQRPSSLRACQHALDLCVRCGIATSPFLFVLNRCAKNAPFTSIDASCALRGAHVAELKDGGRDVDELLGAGLPIELLESKNDLCTSLERLLLEVLPDAGRAAQDSGSDERGSGLRLLKGRRPRKRKRGASCL